jgi:hypothetical protein
MKEPSVRPVPAPVLVPAWPSPASLPSLLVVGSRSWSASVAPALAPLERGGSAWVGCCVGADAAFLSAAAHSLPSVSLRVFAAFGPAGEGAVSVSASPLVRSLAQCGRALVSWWAGGGPSVPVRGRLAGRASALVAAAAAAGVAACVAFLAPGSVGALRAASLAAASGVPVWCVFASAQERPASLGAGAWLAVAAGSVPGLDAGCTAWSWSPLVASQLSFGL